MEVYINGEVYIKRNFDIFSVENNPLLDSVLNLTDEVVSIIENQDEVDELNSMRSSLLEDMKRRIPSETINNIILNMTQTSVFGNSILETMYHQIDFLTQILLEIIF